MVESFEDGQRKLNKTQASSIEDSIAGAMKRTEHLVSGRIQEDKDFSEAYPDPAVVSARQAARVDELEQAGKAKSEMMVAIDADRRAAFMEQNPTGLDDNGKPYSDMKTYGFDAAIIEEYKKNNPPAAAAMDLVQHSKVPGHPGYVEHSDEEEKKKFGKTDYLAAGGNYLRMETLKMYREAEQNSQDFAAKIADDMHKSSAKMYDTESPGDHGPGSNPPSEQMRLAAQGIEEAYRKTKDVRVDADFETFKKKVDMRAEAFTKAATFSDEHGAFDAPEKRREVLAQLDKSEDHLKKQINLLEHNANSQYHGNVFKRDEMLKNLKYQLEKEQEFREMLLERPINREHSKTVETAEGKTPDENAKTSPGSEAAPKSNSENAKQNLQNMSAATQPPSNEKDPKISSASQTVENPNINAMLEGVNNEKSAGTPAASASATAASPTEKDAAAPAKSNSVADALSMVPGMTGVIASLVANLANDPKFSEAAKNFKNAVSSSFENGISGKMGDVVVENSRVVPTLSDGKAAQKTAVDGIA